MVQVQIRGNNELSKFFPAFCQSTDGHMNYGLIVSSVSAHCCRGTNDGFPLRHKCRFFFFLMNILRVMEQLCTWVKLALVHKHTTVFFEYFGISYMIDCSEMYHLIKKMKNE